MSLGLIIEVVEQTHDVRCKELIDGLVVKM